MKKLILCVVLPVMITACHSGVKKTLGMERNQPDEFSVVERAPLTVPPNFDLLPPTPGAARPQEDQTSDTAQGLVLGNQPSGTIATSQSEKALLSQAGVTSQAAVEGQVKQGTVLNAQEEAKRLQQKNIPTTSVPSPVVKNAQ